MSNNNWQKGYKEVKNVIHNDIGVTKDEILEVFREVAKDEIQELVSQNKGFIYGCVNEVIQREMVKAVESKNYPNVLGNMRSYLNENTFQNYIAEVMKNEILKTINTQFEVNVDIGRKNS